MKKTKFGVLLVAGAVACGLVATLGLAGCGESGSNSSSSAASDSSTAATQQAETTLQVFAANSLEKALPEVQALYTQAHPEVAFADSQFKGSDELVTTLSGGGTADVLIAASTATMDKAQENGSIDEATRADMFVNDLVIATTEDSKIEVSDLKDLATDAIKTIAIGDPNVVPAGKYAAQSLDAAGLATYTENEDKTVTVEYGDAIKGKMNDGADKVGTVAQYVAQGEAEVGFVYSSDIYRYDGIKAAFTVPADTHKAIKYPGAVCTSSANSAAAADFLKFCVSDPQAQQVFAQYGFELAAE